MPPLKGENTISWRRTAQHQLLGVETTSIGSPGCLLRQWREQLYLSENLAAQWPHVHGCWPLWTRWWRRSTVELENRSPHCGHRCRRSRRSGLSVATLSAGRPSVEHLSYPSRRWRQAAATACATNVGIGVEESFDVTGFREWSTVWTEADAGEDSLSSWTFCKHMIIQFQQSANTPIRNRH